MVDFKVKSGACVLFTNREERNLCPTTISQIFIKPLTSAPSHKPKTGTKLNVLYKEYPIEIRELYWGHA